jgi:hypothetical protein
MNHGRHAVLLETAMLRLVNEHLAGHRAADTRLEGGRNGRKRRPRNVDASARVVTDNRPGDIKRDDNPSPDSSNRGVISSLPSPSVTSIGDCYRANVHRFIDGQSMPSRRAASPWRDY